MSEIRPRRDVRRTLPTHKRIARIAHDGKKDERLEQAGRWISGRVTD